MDTPIIIQLTAKKHMIDCSYSFNLIMSDSLFLAQHSQSTSSDSSMTVHDHRQSGMTVPSPDSSNQPHDITSTQITPDQSRSVARCKFCNPETISGRCHNDAYGPFCLDEAVNHVRSVDGMCTEKMLYDYFTQLFVVTYKYCRWDANKKALPTDRMVLPSCMLNGSYWKALSYLRDHWSMDRDDGGVTSRAVSFRKRIKLTMEEAEV